MSKSNSRNNNIDLLKIVLSLFVVAAHIFPTTEVEGSKSYVFYMIQGLARLTLPLFLLITGYFISAKIHDLNFIKKTAKKLFILFIVWQLLYFKIEYDFFKLNAISTLRFISDLFYGIGHLWYLIATCLALFLIYFTRKLSDINKLILGVFLISIGYLLQVIFELKLVTNPIYFNIFYGIGTSRNFLFYAFPYLLIGVSHNLWMKDAKKYKFLLLPLLVLLIAESFYYMGINSSIFNIFILPLPLSMLIFSWVTNLKQQFKYSTPSTLSLGFYLIHFYIILEVFKKYQSVSYFSYYLKFLIVVLGTFVVWYILDKINKKIAILF
ncbi:hypothetical protein EQG63_06470 [Flavobacterium amnicola]|uniref:Acyltransferase 3 domain-containing protein n=1 Tax=Flavobacterium amnicola TaxID=2506422 RepID=A0A4Q1K2Q8_9FLAO|nr:acyltransferase family protein [Flavobacterium amnicola]RXR19084.1 hypothetical protein EQG63_06470 [Flavobacterium amnicola]